MSGEAWTREVLANETRTFEQARMDGPVFAKLVEELKLKANIGPSDAVSVEQQLLMFLYIVCHGNTSRDAQDRFQHSGETISRYFHRINWCWIAPSRLAACYQHPWSRHLA